MQSFQVLSSGTPNSSFFRTKTRLNDVFAMDLALRNGEYKERSGNQVFNGLQQPRKPGSLPTPGAATKTLVQAGHVTLSKIFCLVGWGKYQITCFHIQAIHFKCKERDVVVAKNNMNFLI